MSGRSALQRALEASCVQVCCTPLLLHTSGRAGIFIAPLRERKSRVAGEKDDCTFISVHQSAPSLLTLLFPSHSVPSILFPPPARPVGGGQRIISGVLSEATHSSLCFHEALTVVASSPSRFGCLISWHQGCPFPACCCLPSTGITRQI